MRLSKRTLFAYGVGDFASNLCWTFIGSFLSIFYTDVVGLLPATASAIMLIAKIWDGINDPMFGAIAERTNTKKGRFRPYIFYGAPVLAVLSVLAFTTLGTGRSAVIYAAITYIGCGMAYTVVNLSYGSLSTVMTTNPEDIAQLNSYRMMGTNLSSVILNAITPPMLLFFSNQSQNYTKESYLYVAIIFAVCALPLFYFVYANCKETIIPIADAHKMPVKDSFRAVLTNKPLMLLFCIQLLAMTAFFGRMGVVIYYLMYNVQRMDLISAFMSLPSLCTVIGIFLTKNFVVRVGKKKMAAIGYIGAGASLIAIYLIGWSNISLLLALHCIYGFFCFSFPIPMAMIPDAINYEEDRIGIRADGMSYAVVSLSTKFGSAFGVSGALIIMGIFGYVGNQQQTAQALYGINLTTNLVFGIMYLLCLIPLFFYPLNEKMNEEIIKRLDQRRDAKLKKQQVAEQV